MLQPRMWIDKETDSSSKGPAAGGSRRPWHAVVIVAGPSACAAALGCKGKRYLSKDAPRLPLAACDTRGCQCKYRHYEDRRGPPRRAEERGSPPARVAMNQRKVRGRRVTD
jgi:hypothetical protein